MSQLTHGLAQDLLETYGRAWEGRDPELAMTLFADDAEYREDPFEEPLRGNEIRAMWNDAAALQTHIEFDAERIWVSGSTILASWHAAFTRRTSAERVRLRGFMTLEIDGNGKVWRFREWTVSRVVGTDSTLGRRERIPVGGSGGDASIGGGE